MVSKISAVCALLLAVAPAWPQAANPGGTNASDTDSAQMLMPPPISATGFSVETGGEERSNYFSGSVAFNGGYVTNLYPGTGTSTIDDELYFVQPTISMDHATDRSHEMVTYSPSFAFYNPNSTLNTVNHSANATFLYRLSPHVNLLAGDTFTRTSDTWSQPLSSSSVSGGLPAVSPGIVIPFAPQLSDAAYAQLTWQLSRNDMIGFSGASALLDFSVTPEAQGLYNSNARLGSVFYTHRISQRQYIGGTYEYSEIVATPALNKNLADADLDAHNILGFYTAYLTPTFSISLGGGSQRYTLSQAGAVPAEGWAPSGIGSLGWQGLHTSLALSYSRMITDGEGLLGAYSSNAINLSGRWQVSRNWTASLSGNYSDFAPVAQLASSSLPGGHTLSGAASVGRNLGQHLSFDVQYQRLHQDYAGIRALSYDPNSSNESGSIIYHFSRPLGR